MDTKLKQKARQLTLQTRVITLGISTADLPWTAPVYFVYHDRAFFFFSNPSSKHIIENSGPASASIFHDADDIKNIYGFQMSGSIKPVSQLPLYFKVVHKYIKKFEFLKKAFGPQITEDHKFFLKKFKSHLYGFYPDEIYLSDNSRQEGKRVCVSIEMLQTCIE